MLAPKLVQLREFLCLESEASAFSASRGQPLVGTAGVVDRLRLPPRVVRGRSASHAKQGQRCARAFMAIALEDLFGRKLVRERGIVRQTEHASDDHASERKTR